MIHQQLRARHRASRPGRPHTRFVHGYTKSRTPLSRKKHSSSTEGQRSSSIKQQSHDTKSSLPDMPSASDDTTSSSSDDSLQSDPGTFTSAMYAGDEDVELPVLSSQPIIIDALETETSRLQEDTIAECLPLLKRKISRSTVEKGKNDGTVDDASASNDTNGTKTAKTKCPRLPRLNREAHIKFLRGRLGKYPSYFAAMDASRPWVFYWVLNGLRLMGEEVGEYAERYVQYIAIKAFIIKEFKLISFNMR